MAPKLIDPLAALKADRTKDGQVNSSDIIKQASRAKPVPPTASLEARCKADFRVFLTVLWRHLLGVDPSPIQLDMAYWLQHGPDRSIIMAFRGFSKSWITGAYALWRLYCDPDEKVMIVSGSLARAIATTNWALSLIMTVPLLAAMKPKADYRQSGQQFDVGTCKNIGQSASFSAFGIGGQLVGFRGSCIIPDDVETQTNSLTVTMREKIAEAVKEFESVLTPGGVIKYLGTPHDTDSLYLRLLRLTDKQGRPVYRARVWPALFPSAEEIKGYGDRLAPYILHEIRKRGPSIVGHTTMPNRFPDEDLEGRRAAMGNSEFQLQFMLDLSATAKDAYPLLLKDLTVMDLDDRMGPDEVIWGNKAILRDLPVMGHDGDFWYGPVEVDRRQYVKYTETIGFVDTSGRGADETALAVVAELYGRLFLLHLWASKDGFSEETLKTIAAACIRFNISALYIEANFGDGMFASMLRPILHAAWAKANRQRPKDEHGGTRIEETRANRVGKEKRILAVLEPITQQHRLVVNRAVVEWDYKSVMAGEGDNKHRYALGYQYTHITPTPNCLGKDDRLDAVAGACGVFAPRLGVDPLGASQAARDERYDEELEKMLQDEDEAVGRSAARGADIRAAAVRPTSR